MHKSDRNGESICCIDRLRTYDRGKKLRQIVLSLIEYRAFLTSERQSREIKDGVAMAGTLGTIDVAEADCKHIRLMINKGLNIFCKLDILIRFIECPFFIINRSKQTIMILCPDFVSCFFLCRVRKTLILSINCQTKSAIN